MYFSEDQPSTPTTVGTLPSVSAATVLCTRAEAEQFTFGEEYEFTVGL